MLVNTEIMVNDGVSLSGLLLFGNTPKRFLPQAGVDAAAFLGMEKNYAAVEQLAMNGPMTPLMDQDSEILESGIVDQALEFVRRNTPMTASLDYAGRRVEQPAYPKDAIREALVML